MATVAEFTIPPCGFPLGAVFEHAPDATVELDRLVPAGERVAPYVWMHDVERDAATAALEGVSCVAGIERVDSGTDRHLFHVEWSAGRHGVLSVLAETPTALNAVVGTSESWTFEVRGDDRGDVAALMAALEESDLAATLTSVHDLDPGSFDEFDLTDAQREALTLAHERGYYESPRKMTLDELADELGISRQALGSRLRRGLDQLLDATVS